MPEYTYKDVIIDPEDPRAKIGERYYFGDTPKAALECARANGEGVLLEDIEIDLPKPFATCDYEEAYPCIIRKKDPKKRYMPFDLSDAAVREELWGKRIIINEPYSIGGKPYKREVHSMITGFTYCMDGEPKDDWTINAGECSLNAEEALEYAHFYDSTPCGRLVEEE